MAKKEVSHVVADIWTYCSLFKIREIFFTVRLHVMQHKV